MIRIGLCGWNDHPLLYADRDAARNKLKAYGSHFPIVEIDSAFYAVQPESNYAKWAEDTPESFSFIVKAYQGMTGHARGGTPYEDRESMFRAFRESIRPLLSAGKLGLVLFQYPPWFDCNRDNVETLRYAKEAMGDMPLALEFRHRSWYEGDMRDKTLEFMKLEGWIHTVCDEPQAGMGSVPIVLEATDSKRTLVRMHGRNVKGWHSSGQPNWRDVRYLYRYSQAELAEWAERLRELERQSEQVDVLFNNNSGGDAAANAKQLQALLGIDFEGLHPRQMELF